jgi:hypothetical protein
MTLCLIRAESRGEHEQKFLDEGRVYVAWAGQATDPPARGGRPSAGRLLPCPALQVLSAGQGSWPVACSQEALPSPLSSRAGIGLLRPEAADGRPVRVRGAGEQAGDLLTCLLPCPEANP